MSRRYQPSLTASTLQACRWLAAALAGYFVLAAPAAAQIEWFAANQMSYVSARAHASVGTGTEDRCVFASLKEPKFCPWCRQWDRCRRLQLSPGTSATADERVRVDARSLPMLNATSRAAFGQGIDFQSDGFRMDLRVATDYRNQGTHGPGNRGIGTVSGEAYLRVPDGTTIEYVFDGRMQWSAATAVGMIQVVGVPNTGADLSAGFGFHAHQLPGGSPAKLSHSGTLRPGLYRLIWSIGVDSIGRQTQQGFALLADFRVQRRSWPQCVPDGGLTDRWSFPSTTPSQMTPIPVQMTPIPIQSPARSTSESALVDINLDPRGSMLAQSVGQKFASMRRQQLDEATLPVNSCVVVAHGDPDSVLDTSVTPAIRLSATDLAKKIADSQCQPDEPVVLLACNTGRPRMDGGLNFAEQLTRALRSAGRRNTTVCAPTAYVEAGNNIPGLTDPNIVLDSTNISEWVWFGHLSPPQAVRDVAPQFVCFTPPLTGP